MKLKFSEEFRRKLGEQVSYIAKDKPSAARKFRKDLLDQIRLVPLYPFKCKRSIYFEDDSIRGLTFKGYTVLYQIDDEQNAILVFSFLKYQEDP